MLYQPDTPILCNSTFVILASTESLFVNTNFAKGAADCPVIKVELTGLSDAKATANPAPSTGVTTGVSGVFLP
ncbi:MAG: hypothetical protein ACOX0B_02925 [Minisyncoccales bacterium]